jgi:hypothetical protein
MAVRRARPEQQLQKAVLDHLRWRAVPCTFAFHPANGGWRSAVEACILKSQGVVAGVPDVIVVHNGKTYGLELKAAGGRGATPTILANTLRNWLRSHRTSFWPRAA